MPEPRKPGEPAEPEAAFAPRSLLFVPGGRLDMVAKIPRIAPDAAVVDLEDAVSPPEKATVRFRALAAIAALETVGVPILVRVNPVGSPWWSDDVAAAAATSAVAGVVVPKVCEGDIDAVRSALGDAGRPALRDATPGGMAVVAGIETASGVAGAEGLLGGESRPDAAYFGAEDFVADMGGRRSAGNLEVLYARSRVCLAARLGGIPALDQVVVAVADDDRFQRECTEAVAIGYSGKMCLHPRQVALANAAFSPTGAEVAHALAVLNAVRAGVGVVDGEMVDGVHARMAARVLARAQPSALGVSDDLR